MLFEMLENMLPSIIESTAIVMSFIGLGILCIYIASRLLNSYYNRPAAKVSYIEHTVDLLNTTPNTNPSLKANTFNVITSLTEKADILKVNEVYKPRLERLKKKA